MNKSTRGARHQVGTVLALAVLIYGLTSPGDSLSSAARQAAPGRTAARLNSRPGTQADQLSDPLRPSWRYGQDKDAEEIHTPEQGGKIAFSSDRDGNFEIYLIDPDGGGLTRVTEDPADDVQPAWSPDGQRLAFVSNRDGNQEIYAMNLNGSGLLRLTNNAAADLNPAWSPDGTKIAFVSNRDGNDEIYVLNAADGSNVTRLTNNTADDVDPAWAPSGSLLAFASNRDGDKFEIYRMSSTGTNLLRLTNNSFNDVSPSWPPARITFQTDRDANDEIYTMDINGNNLIRLTNNADNAATPGVDESLDMDPSRSSDGSTVVFVSARDGNLEIYSTNADGSAPVRLTNSAGSDIDPAVQPLTSAQGTVQFGAATFSVAEGAGSAAITVTRTGSTAGTAVVDFATVSGTASERTDFAPVIRTLTFLPGEASKTVSIPIINDVHVEGDETFSVTLSNATTADLGSVSTAVVTITDNDTTTSTTNPIDNTDFFVRQQYLDILSREPDAGGFAFWTGRLNTCTATPGCSIVNERIAVAGGFFFSREFFRKGYFAYRFYRASLGRRPTYTEFSRDLARLQGLTDAEEEASRAAFTSEFVTRAEFRASYDGLSDTDFVNRLVDTAGVTLNRNALLQLVQTQGRAAAVRNVVESQLVADKFFKEAVVATLYFGYLKRDPDESGFQFWLQRLDPAAPGPVIGGFIFSREYRRRFGPE